MYQRDAKIAELEAELRRCGQKLQRYQAAAGELEGQCQDQAAEISDLQQQLDGARAEDDEVSVLMSCIKLSLLSQNWHSGSLRSLRKG